MPDSQIVLQTQELSTFEESSFLHSLTAIENFFGSIDNALKQLEDDRLIDLVVTIDALGQRAWFTRCLIIEEIERRTKERLDKPALSSSEFTDYVAKAVNLSKSAAYEDMALLRAIRAHGIEPRLDRTFYRIALRAPDFKRAVEHAEEEYDTYQGKYTTRAFNRWVEQQRMNTDDEPAPFERGTSVYLTADEIDELITVLTNIMNWDDTDLVRKLTEAKKRAQE